MSPTWKCEFFARKEQDWFYWNIVENCGLCINWCDGKCIHHEQLKVQGVNEGKEKMEEINSDSGFISDVVKYDGGV